MIFEFLKQQRRRRLRARPFPKEWLKLIQRHIAFFRKLSASDKAELLGHIQVFLAEKRFEGCGGFAITDEVRVTIAAQAFFYCCIAEPIISLTCSRFSFIHCRTWWKKNDRLESI